MRRLADFAPDHVGDPNKAIYRIYRDTRFSKNKTPYKTHIAAVFPRCDLQKHGGAGYYFSVSPEEIEVGRWRVHASTGGLAGDSRPLGRELQRVSPYRSGARRSNGSSEPSMAIRLTRVPKGFAPDDPAADLLRLKQYLLFANLDVKLATTPKLYREVAARFKAMTPFLEFLNKPFAQRR